MWALLRRHAASLLCGLLCAGLTGGLFGAVRAQATQPPQNMLQGIHPARSHIMLEEHTEIEVPEKTLTATGARVNKAQPSPRPAATGQRGASRAQSGPPAVTGTGGLSGLGGGGTPGGGGKAASPPPQSAAPGPRPQNQPPRPAASQPESGGEYGDDLVYFTTSIRNGQAVSSRSYSFTITHKQRELAVEEVSVWVNDSQQVPFTGSVQLAEGANTILVAVRYRSPEGQVLTPQKTYSVPCEPGAIVLDTDLADKTVHRSEFSFRAAASRAGEEVALRVSCNGAALSSGNGQYSTMLREGGNTITLLAESGTQREERSYTLHFEEPALRLVTSLDELGREPVKQEAFSFTATLEGGSADARLSVRCNGKTLQGSNGQYTASLNNGENDLRLRATDSAAGVDEEYRYTVTLKRELTVVQPGQPPPAGCPTLETNLPAVVEGTAFTLEARAKAADGSLLYASDIALTLNTEPKNASGTAGDWVQYDLKLAGGLNTLNFVVTDHNGVAAAYPYTLTCKTEKAGFITVSIEAGTVGLQLIASTQRPIHENDTGLTVVQTLLAERGYEMELDADDYLVGIGKQNITQGWAISDELRDFLAADGIDVSEPAGPNLLGHRNYYQSAGWVYSINGKMPTNGALDKYIPQNGDVLRVCFSLNYGKDTGQAPNGYGKAW